MDTECNAAILADTTSCELFPVWYGLSFRPNRLVASDVMLPLADVIFNQHGSFSCGSFPNGSKDQ